MDHCPLVLPLAVQIVNTPPLLLQPGNSESGCNRDGILGKRSAAFLFVQSLDSTFWGAVRQSESILSATRGLIT